MGFKKKHKKFPEKICLYIPEDNRETVQKAKDILDREGSSLSKKMVEFCRKYVDLHGHGNPQRLMDKFTKPQPSMKCEWWKGCDEEAVYLCDSMYPFGSLKKYCQVHTKRAQFKGDVGEVTKL